MANIGEVEVPVKVVIDCSQAGKPGMEYAEALAKEALQLAMSGNDGAALNIMSQARHIAQEASMVSGGVVVPLTPEEIEQRHRDAEEGARLQSEFWRTQRNGLLAQCDWTQIPGAPLTEEKKAEWATYRQVLRDLAFDVEPTWPKAPA